MAGVTAIADHWFTGTPGDNGRCTWAKSRTDASTFCNRTLGEHPSRDLFPDKDGFPVLPNMPEVERSRKWGDFLVELTITGTDPLPKKGGEGMGRYRPRRVLLRWATSDGLTFRYEEAILVGPNVDFGGIDSSITIQRGDEVRYPECVPAWLEPLIAEHAPR